MPWRIVGINFDHFHMGDLLRMASEHPDAEIVGVCDERPERMAGAIDAFGIPPEGVFTDWQACLNSTRPDLVILCPATAGRAEWVERIATRSLPVMIEKPFAASLAEADRMIAAMQPAGKPFAINWPLRWVKTHAKAKALIDEGAIGEPREVHYYGGNRGPLWHGADKVEKTPEAVAAEKPHSWFYRKAHGGGSLLDYLGYGVTLGTWFLDGRFPIEVTCTTDDPEGLEVDEHSVTVARYAGGLSTFQTRWGTFTDPWTHQPQPKCGFVIVGEAGTISSYDYEPAVRIQTRARPEGYDLEAEPLAPPFQNPVQYLLHCLETGSPVEGPLSPAMSRIGQRIVDTAALSAREKRTMALID